MCGRKIINDRTQHATGFLLLSSRRIATSSMRAERKCLGTTTASMRALCCEICDQEATSPCNGAKCIDLLDIARTQQRRRLYIYISREYKHNSGQG